MATQKEFKQMHRAMKALIKAQDEAGWQSEEQELLANSVLAGLYVCANNKEFPKRVLDRIAEDTAALEAIHKSSLTESMKSTAS